MRTLVTILLPTFKRPKWLEESLKSILSQQGIDLHLVVLDNGSNCLDTTRIIQQYLPRFKHTDFIEHKVNDFHHITEMWPLVKGDFVVEFTDDDRMLVGNIYRKVGMMRDLNADICFSPAYEIDIQGSRTGPIRGQCKRPFINFDDLFGSSRLIMPSVVMSRKAWEIPVQAPHAFGGEWQRHLSILAAGCRAAYSSTPGIELRIHPGSDTNQRGFGQGMSIDMHLKTWWHWMSTGYHPSEETTRDMYRTIMDLAFTQYGFSEGFSDIAREMVELFQPGKC